MTSVFYDVICLEAVRDSSNMPKEGPFLTVFGGIWAPKCCRPSYGPSKVTSLRNNQRVLWAVVRHNPSTNDFSRWVVGKKNKKERPYISRISSGAHFRPIGTNVGLRVRLVDVINCAKFYRNRSWGFDSVRGRSLTIPIGLRCRR